MPTTSNFNISFRDQDFEVVEKLMAEFVSTNKSHVVREAIHFAYNNLPEFKRHLLDIKKRGRDDGTGEQII